MTRLIAFSVSLICVFGISAHASVITVTNTNNSDADSETHADYQSWPVAKTSTMPRRTD